ncbi:GAP family protein (plasmid) [Coraliomargarita sp. W4R53]
MQTLGHLLPLAVAFAVSSVPITAAIFILLSPNRSRSAMPFLLGWVSGAFVVVSACTLLAHAISTPRLPRRPETTIGALEIVVGAALILLAVVTWLRARRVSDPKAPTWLGALKRVGPWTALGVALLLNLRPKAVLLAIAAGLAIRADTHTAPAALIAIAVYTVIGVSTVALPIIATLVSPTKMEPHLVSAREWLLRNGSTVTSVILVIIGVVVIGVGIARM